MDFIHNFRQFKNDCLKNKNKYRLLSKVYFKPYFLNLTVDHLEKIIDEYELPVKVEFVGSSHQKKLLYSPGQRWELLHLLDDQYFTSSMTNIPYQARGKNEVKRRAAKPTVRRLSAKTQL